ncbi:dodecin family protein [Cryobacterium glaciale]|uniref:Dodecin family protein n=1 Tax=Cryobacterium glaciale TaxID=1259145 RepID=A0A4V3I7V8_9MICO|nr:dodecin [Cryobacterium glaciale]TFB71249.1 dodecin family protein [Cryobacterium glaciale]
MTDNSYRVVEVVGTWKVGSDEAIANPVRRASETVENLDWFVVVQIKGHIEDGAVDHCQVDLKLGFRLKSVS